MSGDQTQTAVEVFVVLLAGATLVALVTRRLTLLPYSVALVVVGLAISALRLPLEIHIDPHLLLAVLIPGLIFEAAYRIDLRELWPNLAAVMALGTVGVLITAAVVAAALTLVAGLPLPLAFLAGTILAATDPVAVIAVMGRLRAPRRLTTLIESESLFNDGTGIVVFALALEAMRRDVAPLELLAGLAVAVVVSIGLGAAIGFLTSRVLANIDDHLVELTLSVVAAYGSYLLAERLGQSGILATVACGLVFSLAGRRAASARAEDAIDTVWEFIAFLLTTLVFPPHRARDQPPAARAGRSAGVRRPGRPPRVAGRRRLRDARWRLTPGGTPRLGSRGPGGVAAPHRLGRLARRDRGGARAVGAGGPRGPRPAAGHRLRLRSPLAHRAGHDLGTPGARTWDCDPRDVTRPLRAGGASPGLRSEEAATRRRR